MKWPIRKSPFDLIMSQWTLLLLYVQDGVHILPHREAHPKHAPFQLRCMLLSNTCVFLNIVITYYFPNIRVEMTLEILLHLYYLIYNKGVS